MKKIYLYAVALSSVFAGCSSDTLVEDNMATNTNIAYKAKTQSSLAELVTEISTGCKDITFTDAESLIASVEYEAFKSRDFRELAAQGYGTPTPGDWNYISDTAKSDIINRLSYSPAVKSYLYAIIVDNQGFSESFFENSSLTGYEKQLLETCRLLNDYGDDKDLDNDMRPIAFAYGYQTSEANAVIMAIISSVNP